MIVDVSKKILIVGLGLLGGSYAKVLKRFGFHISAITKDQSSIDFALKEGLIDEGSIQIDEKMIGEADLVIFALYPHVFVEWIEQHQHLLKSQISRLSDIFRQQLPERVRSTQDPYPHLHMPLCSVRKSSAWK